MNMIKLVTKKMIEDKACELRGEILSRDKPSVFDACFAYSQRIYYQALRRIIKGFGFSKYWKLKGKKEKWVLLCGRPL